MLEKKIIADISGLSPFDRHFFDSKEEFTYIGSGSLGGKARGLALMKEILKKQIPESSISGVSVNIPTMTVITTDTFDTFMRENNLYDTAFSGLPDDQIALKFIEASLPMELLGDLRALITQVHTPLAVRSSSFLEDAMYEPFAGVYATKMIPNNQPDADTRFRKLVEAVKFVYASTFFKEARDYMKASSSDPRVEKMAVIIQEVVGQRFRDSYYPNISGVARSYNFYPMGRSRPEDGVVNLALGLGKTIVDGGICWTYSPSQPKAPPPFGDIGQLMENSQKKFWAVNMGKPPAYDPVKETEYMFELELREAEEDGVLELIASTYDFNSERLSMGTSARGPRVITFAPVLALNMIPLNDVVMRLLKVCGESLGCPVEIEFAVTFDPNRPESTSRFGFLQVRPMVVSEQQVSVSDEELKGNGVLASTESALGNGTITDISDVIYVKPGSFDPKYTEQIAGELSEFNSGFDKEKTRYLLIGFGRWGSSDKWLGIPVNWGQISMAKVIVESMLPNMNVDLSQGSHFFHNITSFNVLYFSIPHAGKYGIDWDWLEGNKTVKESNFVRHVKLASPLKIKVDGRTGRGIILK